MRETKGAFLLNFLGPIFGVRINGNVQGAEAERVSRTAAITAITVSGIAGGAYMYGSHQKAQAQIRVEEIKAEAEKARDAAKIAESKIQQENLKIQAEVYTKQAEVINSVQRGAVGLAIGQGVQTNVDHSSIQNELRRLEANGN